MRKSKTVGSDTLTYYYNGDDIINESKNGSNTTSYLMGADGYICHRQSGQYEYYFKNAHGDVVYAMYTNGGCLGNFRYTAWGESVSDYSFYGGIDQVPIRYAGEYYDYESGMTYLRARYYDSDIKRFITEDPAKDGLNWYAYCGNNPVMFVDPTGYITEEEQQMYENGELSPGAYSYLMVCTYYYYLEDTEEGKAWWNQQAENFRNSGYTDTGNEYWNWALDQMSSRPSGETISEEEHYFRNCLNIQFEWDDFEKLNGRLPDNLKWKELPWYESIFHKFSLEDWWQGNNRKYVSACEHFEVVYTKENYLVDESFNSVYMGTYNYYGPSQPAEHKKYDVDPYFTYRNVP